jgi:hypothetical protein
VREVKFIIETLLPLSRKRIDDQRWLEGYQLSMLSFASDEAERSVDDGSSVHAGDARGRVEADRGSGG